jgi:hypothetical protein
MLKVKQNVQFNFVLESSVTYLICNAYNCFFGIKIKLKPKAYNSDSDPLMTDHNNAEQNYIKNLK